MTGPSYTFATCNIRTKLSSPKVARLLKRIERLAELPAAEQRAVLKVVDGFLDSFTPARPRRRAAPPPRAKRKVN